MNDLVGIIRREGEMTEALQRLQTLRARADRVAVEGHRQFNPGWHLALDLHNMLDVSECIARAALERTESRGGHTREDHPDMDPEWRRLNLVCRLERDEGAVVTVQRKPVPTIPRYMLQMFDRGELEKYFTAPELDVLDRPAPPGRPRAKRGTSS